MRCVACNIVLFLAVLAAPISGPWLWGAEQASPPTTAPATTQSTTAAAALFEYRVSTYLLGGERIIEISADGQVLVVERASIDRPPPRETVRRTGILPPAALADVVQAFKGWEQLGDRYPGVPDGAEYLIRFKDKTVAAGYSRQMPEVFRCAHQAVEKAAGEALAEKPR